MPEAAPKPTARLDQEPLFMSALHRQEKMLSEDPNSPIYDEYTRLLEGMASTYEKTGHFKEASTCYRSLLDLLTKNDGKSSTPAKAITEKLADSQFKLGKYGEAEKLYTDLLSYVRISGEEERDHTNDLRLKHATSLFAQGRYTDAAPEFKRALRKSESDQVENPDYAITCARLAECYRMRSLWADAIAQYEHASEAYEHLQQSDSYYNNNRNAARSALVDFYRAYCLYKLDKLDAAAKAFKSAIPQLKKLAGPAQEMTVVALMQYADTQWRQGKYLDAIGTRMKARDMHNLISE